MTLHGSKAIILLGAGASVPAGIPASTEMTTCMLRSASQSQPPIERALNAICGALQTHAAVHNGERAYQPDIERVLNAAQQLANRNKLELTPFVAAWHPAIEALEALSSRPFDPSHIIRDYEGSLQKLFRANNNDIGKLPHITAQMLSNIVKGIMHKKETVLFDQVADFLTQQLIRQTWLPSADSLSYLAPLVAQGEAGQITIATLNYDNTIELQAAKQGIRCDTGIAAWQESGAFPCRDSGVDLIKLHGSANWFWTQDTSGGKKIKEIMKDQMAEFKDMRKLPYGYSLAVIFGGQNKLTAEGPFLDLLIKFRSALAKSNTLIIIGYSGRDPHINHILDAWGREGDAKKTVIVDRANPLSRPPETLAQLPNVEYQRDGAEQAISALFS